MPGGKPKDPNYWSKYRAAHPAYRERQRVLKNQRRAAMTAEERRRDRGTRPTRALPPIPALHTGHPLFDEARRYAGKIHSGFHYLTHPYYDDLVSEITLALVEGRKPESARRLFLNHEYNWRTHVVQVDPAWATGDRDDDLPSALKGVEV